MTEKEFTEIVIGATMQKFFGGGKDYFEGVDISKIKPEDYEKMYQLAQRVLEVVKTHLSPVFS